MKERIVWADIVRIVGIYFIIVLHVATGPLPSKANFLFFINMTLIHICVPLLIMLSGALLIGKKESYKIFFNKRIKRVIIPWITWSCLFTLLVVSIHADYNVNNIFAMFRTIFIQLNWFIILICSLYLLTPAIRIFAQNAKTKDVLMVVLLWFFSVSLLPTLRDTAAFPLSTDNGIVRLVISFIGYFFLGFLITKIQLQKYIMPLFIIFIISVLVTSAYGYYSSINNFLHASMVFDYIAPGIIAVSLSFFSLLYSMEKIYQRLFTSFIKKLLFSISNAALGIYFIHYLFLNRAPLPVLLKNTSYITISYDIDLFINGFLIFVVSFAIIFSLQKIPKVKHFIA